MAKRQKLANVSPKILAAYRAGEIGLDCAMAHAVTDDGKRQNKVFKSLSGYHATDADASRSAITEGEIDATDGRVRFVTLEACENAGGGSNGRTARVSDAHQVARGRLPFVIVRQTRRLGVETTRHPQLKPACG